MTARKSIHSGKTRVAIRRIFSVREPASLSEVASFLNIESAALIAAIENREIAVIGGSEPRLPWNEVAYLALRQWPLKTIFDALGGEASSVLPALLRPVEFSVALPAYQVRMLEVLAQRERLDAGTFLQGHLLDLASGADHALLEEQIPGFLEALFFPFGGAR